MKLLNLIKENVMSQSSSFFNLNELNVHIGNLLEITEKKSLFL